MSMSAASPRDRIPKKEKKEKKEEPEPEPAKSAANGAAEGERGRKRSPSPARARKRSPSPARARKRSPSPKRKRSPSPKRKRSPSPARGRKRSPSPGKRKRSPSPGKRKRSPSPEKRKRSPSPQDRKRSASPEKEKKKKKRSRRRRSPSSSGSPSPERRKKKKKDRDDAPARAPRVSKFSSAPPPGYVPAVSSEALPDQNAAVAAAMQKAQALGGGFSSIGGSGAIGNISAMKAFGLVPPPAGGVPEGVPEVGSVLQGLCERCQPFGAFIKLSGNLGHGMIHTSRFRPEDTRRYETVEEVERVVPPGTTLWVHVLEIKDQGKVALSLRGVDQRTGALMPEAAMAPGPGGGGGGGGFGGMAPRSAPSYGPPPEVNSQHRGFVKRVENYGCFVTLDGFADGMVHVSQLERNRRFNGADEIMQVYPLGAPIHVVCTGVKENGRVELSAACVDQATGERLPEQQLMLGNGGAYGRPGLGFGGGAPSAPPGVPDLHTVHRGVVKRLQPFGAFVTLEGNYGDGLVHISQIVKGVRLNDEHDIAAHAAPGQQVFAYVKEIKANGRYELSMSRVDQQTGAVLPEDPPPQQSYGGGWQPAYASYPPPAMENPYANYPGYGPPPPVNYGAPMPPAPPVAVPTQFTGYTAPPPPAADEPLPPGM